MKKNVNTESGTHAPPAVSVETRIQVLLEEYRALYGLLTFRLTAMDRRLPAVGGTLGAVLGSATTMPESMRMAFLLGLPTAILWLLLSTVQHARSKEDHLRRIDEIERLVNRLAGEELLVFQSRHPNKARHAGGRSGFAAVFGVLTVCLIMLAACAYFMQTPARLLVSAELGSYVIYLAACALLMLWAVAGLTRYRYVRPPPDGPKIFEVYRPDSA